MKELITYKGIIHFDPTDKTKKHLKQSSWKRMAMVLFNGDICEYYAWFIEKRYGLKLNKPLRGGHISFINDSINDIKIGNNCDDKQAEIIWNTVRDKWNGKEVKVTVTVDARSDSNFWWLNIPEKERKLLQSIRTELGLGRPFYGMHMTIGYVNEKNIEHSKYVLNLINKFGKEYN